MFLKIDPRTHENIIMGGTKIKSKNKSKSKGKSKSKSKTKSKRKNIFEEPFVLPENAKKKINLPEPKKIKKIGEFMINGQGAAIGDGYWRKINLKQGIYEAWRMDDNLMIIDKDLKIKPDKKIKTWMWKNSGTGVDVESGTFGFFDLATIKKLSKITNHMPKFEFSTCDMDQFDSGLLIDDRYLEKFNSGVKEDVYFGVLASTQVGDGGFQCFVIDNDRAILIGGLTGETLGLFGS